MHSPFSSMLVREEDLRPLLESRSALLAASAEDTYQRCAQGKGILLHLFRSQAAQVSAPIHSDGLSPMFREGRWQNILLRKLTLASMLHPVSLRDLPKLLKSRLSRFNLFSNAFSLRYKCRFPSSHCVLSRWGWEVCIKDGRRIQFPIKSFKFQVCGGPLSHLLEFYIELTLNFQQVRRSTKRSAERSAEHEDHKPRRSHRSVP